MDLFRINTVARNNNLLLFQGLRSNNSRFSILIRRYQDINNNINNQPFNNYIFSNGSYYTISVENDENINNQFNNNNINNFLWEHTNYNGEFPFYMYGLTNEVYYYIKGLIISTH